MAGGKAFERCWIVVPLSKQQAQVIRRMIKEKIVPKAEVSRVGQPRKHALITSNYETLEMIYRCAPSAELRAYLQPFTVQFRDKANLQYKPWPPKSSKRRKHRRSPVEPTRISVPKEPNTATFGGMHKSHNSDFEGGRADGN